MIGIGGVSTVPLVFIKKPGIIGMGGVDLGGIQTDKVLYLPNYIMPDGKLMDRSGNNYHGTRVGVTRARLPSGQWLETYDGDDYIEATAPLMNFTSEDFSIFAWVKTTNLTTYNMILCRGLTSNDGYHLQVLPTGVIQMVTSHPTIYEQTLSAAGAVVTGQFYRLGFARSGASVRIYKNGADVTLTAATHINPATCARTVKIGVYDNKTQNFLIGQTGAITVVTAAVTPAWAANDWNQGRWIYGV